RTTFNHQFTSDIKTQYHLYDPIEGGFHRYSTKRDWSTPHYEKMLPDQAKLLGAYARLARIIDDERVEEVVSGTLSFVTKRLRAPDGSFFSSQDAYLEDEYFGLPAAERARIAPPYVDRTRTMDGNAMMITTLLSLDRPGAEGLAHDALEFLRKHMVGKDGAFYYFSDEDAFLSGQSLANAWALLAFVEGASIDEAYVRTAVSIADYALDNLYDWNAGGFFERHSTDASFYAPNERIDLSKPYGPNAVFAYGLLRLYLLTENPAYLESGLKTLGYVLGQRGGLDESYYAIKAARLVQDHNLLDEYATAAATITALVKERQSKFFLDDLLSKEQHNIPLDDAPALQDEFASVGFLILALLAFAAGVLSFLSPCCLPVLTAYFAHNAHAKRGDVLKNTIFFFLGLATVFSVLGMGATLIGSLFREQQSLFTQVAGVIIIILGLLEIAGKGFSGLQLSVRNRKTPIGSYLFGAVFAVGWSACIGPILASLLLLSATTGTLFKGSLLLFIYAIGLGLPLIILSFSLDKMSKRAWKFLRGRELYGSLLGWKWRVHSTSLITGSIIIVLGVLIFNDYLYRLNQLALQSSYVQEVIIRGEEFLKRLLLQ
ncbi:hypothetical protein D6789_00130, partial [Candidatus Woesearchaeota archaeon]